MHTPIVQVRTTREAREMKTTRGKAVFLMSATIAALAAVSTAGAHCQVPCGIYDDEARFTMMLEHVTTLEKAIKQIGTLSREKEPNWNQLVRWVSAKDHHADELAEIVAYYFMTQRIKPPKDSSDEKATKKYATDLELLHKILVHSMKSKQTTDLKHTEALRKLIGEFRESYLDSAA